MRCEVLTIVITQRHIPEDINLYSPYMFASVSAEHTAYIFRVEKLTAWKIVVRVLVEVHQYLEPWPTNGRKENEKEFEVFETASTSTEQMWEIMVLSNQWVL
jgi:hypothetical protein